MFDTPTHTKHHGHWILFKSEPNYLNWVQLSSVGVWWSADCTMAHYISLISPLYKPDALWPSLHRPGPLSAPTTDWYIGYSGVSAQWFPSYLHVQFERWKWKYYDTLEYTLSNRWILDIIYGQHYVFLCGETSWIFGIITMNLFYEFYK